RRRLVELGLEDGLDRDPAAELRIHALVHHSHGTAADRALDRVAAERLEFGLGFGIRGGHVAEHSSGQGTTLSMRTFTPLASFFTGALAPCRSPGAGLALP